MSTPPFLALPSAARARRIRTPRGGFACLEAVPPADVPSAGTALLVPGFTGGKEDFIALLEPLARRGYRVVAFDQRGQYETPGPEGGEEYARAELVADLWALADAVAPDTAPHVVGHSFGGLVCRSAALEAPGRMASLTLMSTGPAAIQEREVERLEHLEQAVAAFTLEQVWDAMRAMDADAGVQPPADPDVAAYMRTRWLANSPAALVEFARQLRTEPDLTDALAERIRAGLRVLVLSGADDYAWPVPWLAAMAHRLGVPHVLVDGAGHSPNVDDPEATAKGLADFWDLA
ncbi:alpha/beta fold hydrolase [Yinghuangia seranimata]|uniref:alpha/beta fold hydrolase n=1 Tax=Yinghuangia seranimata TaxID=408067 RepID=UPI00248BFCD8|nr:alpha/beta hydrolase [Yinghuangia seranimata]MDI2131014.1 alpha/beta hydrolase [Yinghuangia seranimata]